MTTKHDDKAKSKETKAEEKRVSPDSPLGYAEQREEPDFYQRQRDASPDGMTASEREQHQKAAPGSLNQTDASGEKVGDPEAEQPKATTQSKG